MSDYRVLTAKQQADLAAKLTRANALLAECHAAIVGDQPQVVRRPRKPRAAKPATEAPAPKRRGRPPKAAQPAQEAAPI